MGQKVKTEEQKEHRRQWDREYQRRRYHEAGKPQLERYRIKHGLKKLEQGDTMEKSDIPIKTEVPPVMAGKEHPIMQVANAIKEQLPKDDPVAKAIDRYGKYVPIVLSFVDGFVQRMNEHQATQRGAKPQIEAPEGWTSMSALQREVRKYDAQGNLSAWYVRGMNYERLKEANDIETNVGSYHPVDLNPTYAGQMEAARQARMNRMQPQLKQYESMEEVNRAARAEKWDEKPKPKEVNIAEAEQLTAEKKVEIINDAMRADVERYMQLVMTFFQTRPIEQFEKDLDDIDGLMAKWKPTLDLILTVPIRAAMTQINYQQLEEMLKTADPAKYDLVKNKKLKSKLSKLWEELKKPPENVKP